MARYKVNITVYKDPAGKTLGGPTFLHFIGDICAAIGLIFLLGLIALAMDGKLNAVQTVGFVVTIVVGFALMVVLHKVAKKNAEQAILKSLAKRAEQERLKQQ